MVPSEHVPLIGPVIALAAQPWLEKPPSTGIAVPVTKSDARARQEHGDAGQVVAHAPSLGRRPGQHAIVQARHLAASRSG